MLVCQFFCKIINLNQLVVGENPYQENFIKSQQISLFHKAVYSDSKIQLPEFFYVVTILILKTRSISSAPGIRERNARFFIFIRLFSFFFMRLDSKI